MYKQDPQVCLYGIDTFAHKQLQSYFLSSLVHDFHLQNTYFYTLYQKKIQVKKFYVKYKSSIYTLINWCFMILMFVCVRVWLLPPPLLVGKCCYDSELSAISCGHVCPNDNDAVQVITITTFRLVNLTFVLSSSLCFVVCSLTRWTVSILTVFYSSFLFFS